VCHIKFYGNLFSESPVHSTDRRTYGRKDTTKPICAFRDYVKMRKKSLCGTVHHVIWNSVRLFKNHTYARTLVHTHGTATSCFWSVFRSEGRLINAKEALRTVWPKILSVQNGNFCAATHLRLQMYLQLESCRCAFVLHCSKNKKPRAQHRLKMSHKVVFIRFAKINWQLLQFNNIKFNFSS
jgi:hypothetical protein